MDDYVHEWMAKIRWADLVRAADEIARGRSPEPLPVPDEARRPPAAREPTPWGACLPVVTLTAALWAGSLAPIVAWAHGSHPHGAPTLPTVGEEQLRARSARFDFDPPSPGTYRLPIVKHAGDGAVVDATGASRRLGDVLAGRITVLSFVYTRCSDANGCPLATAVLYQLHAATAGDPELVRHLRLVTLSFDPGHDTPETMAKYSRVAAAREARSPWEFLTTASERQLGPILAAYGQVVQRPAGPVAAGPTHLLRVYLIDRHLRIRNIYGLDFLDPRLLLADVRTLLLEGREARR